MLMCFRTGLRGKRGDDQNQIIIQADRVVELIKDRSSQHDVEKLLLPLMMQQEQEAAKGAPAAVSSKLASLSARGPRAQGTLMTELLKVQ